MIIQRKAHMPASISRALWRRPIFWESAVWLVLCAGWVWVISLGDENGFGYFHQPDNGLLAPLIAGTVINAVLFILNTFYAIPRFLAMGQWRQYAVIIIVLFSANVFLQTSVQKLIILFSEPGLSALSWAALAIENTYIPFLRSINSLVTGRPICKKHARSMRKPARLNRRYRKRVRKCESFPPPAHQEIFFKSILGRKSYKYQSAQFSI